MEIKEDLFDICKRVKEIDEDYYVVFNKKLHRYEIHHSEQYGDSLAIVAPNNKLDANVLSKLYETRRERKEQLFKSLNSFDEGGIC